jgi:hypothetical protein
MAAATGKISFLPYAVAEASFDELSPTGGDMAGAFGHLLDRLRAASDVVLGSGFSRSDADAAAGLRHLLVLLAVGIDEALRFDPQPQLSVGRTNSDDIMSWGMDCPDCVYHRATLRGGESYRVSGNRGTARYVGLQTMDGIAATGNALVDELDVDANGDFELIISGDEHPGNWLPLAGEHPTLVVRHFFYDWDTEVPSSLEVQRISAESPVAAVEVPLQTGVPRQLGALGDFVFDNLTFFLDWSARTPANDFTPPADLSALGGAAENRPVIGRWVLGPDEALILEVEPPRGVYWSYSIGNPWWETIHYGRHQSSLNGHQAVVDSDGKVRVVLSERDPGVANWLDTAGFSNGMMILRCVRTDAAPTPTVALVAIDDVSRALPPDTRRVTPEERANVLASRRRAISERFAR